MYLVVLPPAKGKVFLGAQSEILHSWGSKCYRLSSLSQHCLQVRLTYVYVLKVHCVRGWAVFSWCQILTLWAGRWCWSPILGQLITSTWEWDSVINYLTNCTFKIFFWVGLFHDLLHPKNVLPIETHKIVTSQNNPFFLYVVIICSFLLLQRSEAREHSPRLSGESDLNFNSSVFKSSLY